MQEAIQKWSLTNEVDDITKAFVDYLLNKERKDSKKEDALLEQKKSLQKCIEDRENIITTSDIHIDHLSKKAQDTIKTIISAANTINIREPSAESFLSELTLLNIKNSDHIEKISFYQSEQKKQIILNEQLKRALETFNKGKEWMENQKKEFNHSQKEMDDRINDILSPKSKEYKSQITNYQKELKLSGMAPELEHENLKILYEKMKILEEQLEDMTKEFGSHQDLPLSEQEADAIIYEKQKELESLEAQVSGPFSSFNREF